MALYHAQLLECERQYRNTTHLIGLALLFAGPFLLGLLIGGILWFRYDALRLQVYGMGVPVDAWEAPLKRWRFWVLLAYLLPYLGIALLIFIGFWFGRAA